MKLVAVQRAFFLLGGPHNNKIFKSENCVLYEGQILRFEGHEYEVMLVPDTRDNLTIPQWVLVHESMNKRELIWPAFMAMTRAIFNGHVKW